MEDNSEKSSRKGVSRRKFFKIAATTAVGLALPTGCVPGSTETGGGNGNEPEVVVSPEIELKPTILVLDFFELDEARERIIQENFPPDFSEAETLSAIGITDSSTIEGLKEGVPQTEEQKRILMLNILYFHFKDHGDTSIDALGKTREFLGVDQEAFIPVQQSIAEAISFGEVEFDEVGNLIAYVEIDSEFVGQQIEESAESVVNMSFEIGKIKLVYVLNDTKAKNPELKEKMPSKRSVGDNSLYYDYLGNEIPEEEYNELMRKIDEKVPVLREPANREFELMDGYADENTAKNVRKLVEIAKKFPDKLFVAAGGNPTDMGGDWKIPDITAVRAEHEAKGEWPTNLIVVGFEGTDFGQVSNASLGADVYVSYKDLDRFGLPWASSFATPIVTEAVRQAVSKGLKTPMQVKEWLVSMTDSETTLFPYNQEHEYKVLNLEKVREGLAQLGEQVER